MAELLVRVTDKTHSDVYINATITKRGDVIVVQPDGWPWGRDERLAEFWRIVRVPVPIAEVQPLLAREPETNPTHPSRTRQARAFRLNLDAFPVTLVARVTGRRIDEIIDLPVSSLAEWRALIIRKPQVLDPAVIGTSPAII